MEAEPTEPEFTWFGLVLAVGAAAALVILLALNRRFPDLHAALTWTGALAFIALAGVIGAKLGKASVGRVLDAMVPACTYTGSRGRTWST